MKTPCHRNYRVSLTGCSPVHLIDSIVTDVTLSDTGVKCTVTVIRREQPCLAAESDAAQRALGYYGDSARAPRRRVLPMEEDSIRIIVDWSGS
jgi:hypothetical protein